MCLRKPDHPIQLVDDSAGYLEENGIVFVINPMDGKSDSDRDDGDKIDETKDLYNGVF